VLHSGHANSPYNALVQVLDMFFRIRRIHMKPGIIRDYRHSHPPRRGFKCPTVQARPLEKGAVGVGGNAKACDGGDQPNFVFWDER
jgi:hypothetical protein